MEIRNYGLYIVKDSVAQGRVSGFMPYPSDLAAAFGFKMLVEDEEKMKIFPVKRKLVLVRVCELDQLTDRVIVQNNNFDRTICNAENVYSYIDIEMKKYNSDEEV